MARINIEEKWWSDPRRGLLTELLGNRHFTETVVVNCWRLAQEYWEVNQLIPGHIYITLHGAMALLKCKLARLHESSDPKSPIVRTPPEHISNTSEHLSTHLDIIEQSWIYVRGSEEWLSWGAEIRQKRSEAGKKSAEKRKLMYGSAQPNSNKPRTLPEQNPTNSNKPELSGSGSGSGSDSSSKSIPNKNVGIRTDYPPEFDLLWKEYGRVGDKKEAYEQFKKLKLSESEMESLGQAIKVYCKKKPDPEFRKHFERFLKIDWRDLLIENPEQEEMWDFLKEDEANEQAALSE